MKLVCLCTKADFYNTKEFYKTIIFIIEFPFISKLLNNKKKKLLIEKTFFHLECNEIA